MTFFRANFIIFGTVSTRKWSPIFSQYRRPKLASGFCIVMGFHRSWEATTVVISQKQQCEYKPHLSPSNKCTAACCATLPTRARLRHLPEPMGSDCDGVDYASLASVLAVASDCGIHQAQPQLVSSRTRAIGV